MSPIMTGSNPKAMEGGKKKQERKRKQKQKHAGNPGTCPTRGKGGGKK